MEIAYVNVFVNDLERAIAFYKEKLGLTLQFSSPEHGYASFGIGNLRLGLSLPSTEHPELAGRHTGIGLAVTDLVAEHARLASLGVTFTMLPTQQPWGGFMALLSDPDGNIFYLDQIAPDHP